MLSASISKRIFLIRHGQTEYNHLGLVQGSGIDADLDDTGRLQAAAFFAHYAQESFDKIYTSRLRRTHQSVAPFVQQGLPWQQLEGLNEISWGDKEGRVLTEEDNIQYKKMLSAWRSGQWHIASPGGESPLDVLRRQQRAWKYIMSHDQEKQILVCMHGRAIRILLSHLTGTSLSRMDDFLHSNLCLYVLQYHRGHYHIERHNDTAHIEACHALRPRAKAGVH